MRNLVLPDHFLEKIADPKDRRALGLKTTEETRKELIEQSERELHEQLFALLGRNEVVYIHAPMFRRSQLPPGWPDFSFVYRGVALAWECKVGGEEPNDEQRKMHVRLTANGWKVDVIESLEQAQNILKEINEKLFGGREAATLGE
jgi:hypothetical protein